MCNWFRKEDRNINGRTRQFVISIFNSGVSGEESQSALSLLSFVPEEDESLKKTEILTAEHCFRRIMDNKKGNAGKKRSPDSVFLA
jgi:hypothetical protein